MKTELRELSWRIIVDERKTAPFREQHDILEKIAGELAVCIADSGNVLNNSDRIYRLLTDLARNIKVHLTLEDASLYPVLTIIDDQSVSDVSAGFVQEMGGIKETLDAYFSKWSSGYAIKENSELFMAETDGILKALRDRIERENNVLYPMIDELFD